MGQLNRWLAAERLSAADLAVARAGQVLPPDQAAATTPAEELLASYRRYLARERGVAPLTALRYERMARRFLAGRISRGGTETGAENLSGAGVTACLV